MQQPLIQIREQQRQTWDRFSAGWKQWDKLVLNWIAPVGEELIHSARLRDTSRVLDVAAGTGEPGLSAAKYTPRGKVTITDLSERMLEVAAENAARRGIANVDTRQCDAGDMPFADESFDAVTCRFGFMFFPDINLGLREMVRVSRTGAYVCSAVWGAPDKNSWATTIMGAIAANVEMPPAPREAPGLFRCAAPGFMADAYREAGLENVAETEVAGELEFESPEQYWNFMTAVAAPVVAGLARADEPTREKIRRTVHDLAQQTSNDGHAKFHWSARVISGEKTQPARV
ncbi:MAG: methyltransferase domain-containing protein [Nitrosomonadales bacterium]|nr:methyltransferase domain-containing protein [Nitrosomonadales bacterium]